MSPHTSHKLQPLDVSCLSKLVFAKSSGGINGVIVALSKERKWQ